MPNKPTQYRIVDKVGVVGFNGVIHKRGDVISAADVPSAHLKAWLRFGQAEEVAESTEGESQKSETKGGKK